MTEKRFIIDNDYDIVEFDYHNNEYIQYFMFANGKSWDKICNRLNELYDENEQLKSDNKCYVKRYSELFDEYKKIKKENEQLKTYLEALREELSLADRDNTVLEKENKELKSVLKKTLKQLYNAQTSQIYEYSSNITEEEKQLKEHFKQKYNKYGWKE